MNILTLIVVGVLLWSVLAIVQRLVARTHFSSGVRRRIGAILPGVLFFLWAAFVFWGIDLLFGETEFYTILTGAALVLLVLLFGWFVLRDVVAGVVFSSRNPNIINHRLTIGDVKGTVKRLGGTNLYLQTDSGEMLSIPYSNVAGQVTVEHSRTQPSDRFRTRILIPAHRDAEAVRESLRRELLLLPWVNQHVSPSIILSANEGETHANIAFHCLNQRHAALVEERLRERVEQTGEQA